MHHLISSCGITGELKDLETGDVFPEFKIQASSTAYFNNFTEIDGMAEYWQPSVVNHTPGDSYVPAKGLILQMSVGEKHDINVKGLEDLLDSGAFAPWEDDNPDESIKFVFLLHEEVYDKYNLQSLKSTDNPKHKGTRKNRSQDINSRIKQYSFTINLEQRLQELRNRTANISGVKRKIGDKLYNGDTRLSKRQKISHNK
jgi:hypothetical protein